jgi:hypothetical protein
VLRSTDPDGVRQEIYAYLITYQAIRHLIVQAATDAGVDPDRLSFTVALRTVRRGSPPPPPQPPQPWPPPEPPQSPRSAATPSTAATAAAPAQSNAPKPPTRPNDMPASRHQPTSTTTSTSSPTHTHDQRKRLSSWHCP